MRLSLGIGIGLSKHAGATGVSIGLSGNSTTDTATVGTVVGTASIIGAHTGTPTWSLTNSAGGKYAINSSTGVVTVAAALTAGTDTIAIDVTGTTPAPGTHPKSFNIIVASGSSQSDPVPIIFN